MTNPNAQRLETSKSGDGLAKDILSNVKERSDVAISTVSDGFGQLVAWGKKNPIQAAAVGAGVGFVVGALLRNLISRK